LSKKEGIVPKRAEVQPGKNVVDVESSEDKERAKVKRLSRK
jgi:hypothetical protein